ncbi:hypothetical protein LTR60_004565, partial [Cryomyces antarcticus]
LNVEKSIDSTVRPDRFSGLSGYTHQKLLIPPSRTPTMAMALVGFYVQNVKQHIVPADNRQGSLT